MSILLKILLKIQNLIWEEKYIICLIMCCAIASTTHAQNAFVESNSNIYDDESLEYWKERYEVLEEIAQHPFNINTITKEQLEELPFLSDKLIENILYYVYKYGPLLTINELAGIKGMDYNTQRFLKEYVYVGNTETNRKKLKMKDILKYSDQEVLIRTDIPMNSKAGYANYSQEVLDKYPNRKYYGNALYNNVRYRFSYSDRIQMGITAEKDAGEPFFSGFNKKGYDFYSYYLFMKNIGRLKALSIGHYRASFGYGLVMNMGFTMGKYYSLSTMHRAGTGLSKHSSTNEYDYLQGIGATYQLSKRWKASVFYSCRKMDASIDSMLITSLKTDGMHRLPRDVDKRNKASNKLIGSNIDYNGKYFEFGLTGVYNVFNKKLEPVDRIYNRFYPRGKSFFNAGIYYKFFLKKFIFSGETAVDKKGAVATYNSLSYSPAVNTTFIFINRYYDKKYQSIYARGFGENSKTQNELGFYFCMETSLLRRWRLTCYGDLFTFPYYRYRVDQTHSKGGEGVFQLSYSHSNSLGMLIKYSYKNKALNYTSVNKKKYVLPYIRQRLHYQCNYTMNERTMLKVFADGVSAGYQKKDNSLGVLLGGNAKFSPFRFPFQIQAGGAWFDTKDYASRVYMYEPGLLYSFSSYSFYGNGFRTSLNMRYDIKKRFMVQAKMGWTHYTDRDKIGTGTEEIQGNNKVDIQVQLKLKW